MDKLLLISENITHAANVIYETVNGTVVRIWLFTEVPAPTAPAPPAIPWTIPEPTPWLPIILLLVVTSYAAGLLVWLYGWADRR